MTHLSITETTAVVGKSANTIYRHVTEGKLSATKGVDGKLKFETAELIRVYGPLKVISQNGTPTVNDETQSGKLIARLESENLFLREQVIELREMLKSAQSQNNRLSLGYKEQRFNFWSLFKKKKEETVS